MNRTERARKRSCREAAASSNRQKNDTIRRRNEMIAKSKNLQGEAKRQADRDISHLSECIRKDKISQQTFADDIVVYKKRSVAAKKSVKEISVA